ncbi:MAG: CHAP domain-containing protein [Candidatus Ancillula sp.]|jgi:surface antigen|nr:CHAP domain-containing protein [Candidatus Ancillula sp.]
MERENIDKTKESARLKVRVFASVIVTLALLITGYTTVQALNKSGEEASGDAIIATKTFEVATPTANSLTDESVNVFTKDTSWTPINYTLGFSDKAEREARAQAQAQAAANRLALSRAAIQSYSSVASASGSPGNAPAGPAPLAPGNRYSPGYCTWYAYNRRYQIGRPVHSLWGNGGAWHNSAIRDGFTADHTPEVGAVFEERGHVAVVEAVGDNNTVFISEMNYGQLWKYNTRWVANANSYWYIH